MCISSLQRGLIKIYISVVYYYYQCDVLMLATLSLKYYYYYVIIMPIRIKVFEIRLIISEVVVFKYLTHVEVLNYNIIQCRRKVPAIVIFVLN